VAALQRGTQGTFVYVVKPDRTAEVRPVKIGVSEGNVASVDSGVTPGEMVVTDGQDKLQPGATVEVQGPRPKAQGARRNPLEPSVLCLAPIGTPAS
jgi:multidrug efflux system membrane fusion protein